MSKKQSKSKNLTTPEKIAHATRDFYDDDKYDPALSSAYRKRPIEYKMTPVEKKAFTNPPFSEEDMKTMEIKHNQEQLLKSFERSRHADELSRKNLDNYEETKSMKEGKDTNMNIDGRTSPPPEMIKNPFSSPENSPVKKGGKRKTKRVKKSKSKSKSKRRNKKTKRTRRK